MVGEALAGLSAIKTAFDLAKGLQNIHDAVARDRAVIDLQKEILAAQQAQFVLVERVSELEKEVAGFETWNTEKQRYELKDLGYGSFAYMLKPNARGAEPPTWICTNCYEHSHKATLQYVMKKGTGQEWTCPSCKSTILPATMPKWID